MSTSATVTTRRRPKRSFSAAANGALIPNTTRLTDAAVAIAPWLQPNSSMSGSMRIPNVARMAAAASRATKAEAATIHARCIGREASWVAGATARVAEMTMCANFLPLTSSRARAWPSSLLDGAVFFDVGTVLTVFGAKRRRHPAARPRLPASPSARPAPGR